MDERAEKLKEQIRNLPLNPGVYRFIDVDEKILYIGKAKSLRKRVASYFVNKNDLSYRIRVMVSKIRQIEYTIVNTEYDALLLENSLIKKFQPRYNVNLRDDKTYPFIVIKNEPYPRVFPTRKRIDDGSEYYGPYANVGSMRMVLELVKKLFPTRSCKLALNEPNIAAGKFKVCLEYHIKLCKGPCEGLQSLKDYEINLNQIRNVLKGNLKDVEVHFKNCIKELAELFDFENAQLYKEKLELLGKFQAKSTVVNPLIDQVDTFSMYSNESFAFVNYMRIKNGAIITTDTVEFRKKIGESNEDIIQLAIVSFREKYESNSREVLLPFPIPIEIPNIRITVPKLGDKRKLIELSLKNAFQYFQDKLKSNELNKDRRKNIELLTLVKNDLNLVEIPYHIECFDNSNFQGSFPISAIVVFKNGVPSKKDYRFFNVKTIEGPDDFGTMTEAVTRRYSRMLNEQTPLPQLIIIDGGKGQLSAAVTGLKNVGVFGQVEIISIAKRLEEIYKPGDPYPMLISKKSRTLKLIQSARDEAHRFGITAHRKKRNKVNLHSGLEDIHGIGEETTRKLLAEFKSIKKLKEATEGEIASVVGKAKAKIVMQSLHENKITPPDIS